MENLAEGVAMVNHLPRVAGAALLLVSAGAFAATTPYKASLADTACNGKQSCTLTFAAVPAGEMLTISHVSCGITTSGESAFVNSVVLSSVKATPPGDFLPVELSVDGTNGRATLNLPTLIYVFAGNRPTISITSGASIVGSTEEGCLISGMTTP
jgi:hypothetical protein